MLPRECCISITFSSSNQDWLKKMKLVRLRNSVNNDIVLLISDIL